jgi:hypothetical protein
MLFCRDVTSVIWWVTTVHGWWIANGSVVCASFQKNVMPTSELDEWSLLNPRHKSSACSHVHIERGELELPCLKTLDSLSMRTRPHEHLSAVVIPLSLSHVGTANTPANSFTPSSAPPYSKQKLPMGNALLCSRQQNTHAYVTDSDGGKLELAPGSLPSEKQLYLISAEF